MNDIEAFKSAAKDTAGLLKVLANENRLLILCTLMNQEMSVSELNDHINLSQSALSQHLAVLRKEQVVETRRESQTIYYLVKNPQVLSLLKVLHELFCPEN
ncbi:ArsR/SmtB family transcription factor [Thalassotalea marina]|uniref:Transcriptional regulator n=1 Tax=Thalassotalea marina TaxID=1673741 RepID=A0A919B9M6_9GAMM|nr:metalloregulator ArsR/SmtB family transcription factor [Thalassotalea marina]GHF77242.1 transcriptional regulator [Thalassotalea marina]